jgi:GNAT superfamily N-acetyltransferase
MVYLSLKYRYYHLLNVFVLEEYRGLGLGKFLMNCIMNHTELQGLKRWMPGTEDAHGLYQHYGFAGLKQGAESYGKGDSIFGPWIRRALACVISDLSIAQALVAPFYHPSQGIKHDCAGYAKIPGSQQ